MFRCLGHDRVQYFVGHTQTHRERFIQHDAAVAFNTASQPDTERGREGEHCLDRILSSTVKQCSPIECMRYRSSMHTGGELVLANCHSTTFMMLLYLPSYQFFFQANDILAIVLRMTSNRRD